MKERHNATRTSQTCLEVDATGRGHMSLPPPNIPGLPVPKLDPDPSLPLALPCAKGSISSRLYPPQQAQTR
eukprot:scaffold37030_cov183-Skeletonema_dohrnii-CCMP3373.AAC.1